MASFHISCTFYGNLQLIFHGGVMRKNYSWIEDYLPFEEEVGNAIVRF